VEGEREAASGSAGTVTPSMPHAARRRPAASDRRGMLQKSNGSGGMANAPREAPAAAARRRRAAAPGSRQKVRVGVGTTETKPAVPKKCTRTSRPGHATPLSKCTVVFAFRKEQERGMAQGAGAADERGVVASPKKRNVPRVPLPPQAAVRCRLHAARQVSPARDGALQRSRSSSAPEAQL